MRFDVIACCLCVISCCINNSLANSDDLFSAKIEPLLKKRCFDCHSHEFEIEGGLVLDSRSGWESGGDSGPAIVPGKPEQSLLIKAVSHIEKDLQMPPDKMLPQEEIQLLKEWVRRGANDPRQGSPVAANLKKENAWESEYQKRLDWWSLAPMKMVEPPSLDDTAWSANPVDRFIKEKLDEANLVPAPPADPATLRRRLSFVLTGLPPAAHQELSPEPDFESDVETLLASPHFGERFARHWMDVVRYTDTYGYEWDNPAKGSHEYRDYLIRAFNDDIGYDQFLKEQLAGDLLPEQRIHPDEQTCESLIAPMFYHLGEHRHGSSLAFNGVHQEMVNNKIEAFSKAFLATTVACARCHDHKLEAVSQREYYALAAMLTEPRWTTRVADAPDKHAAAITKLKELRHAIRQELAALWSNSSELHPMNIQKWAETNRHLLENAKPSEIAYPLSRLVSQARWTLPTELRASAEKTEFIIESDHSILATGNAPQADTYMIQFASAPGAVKLLKLEALRHETLPAQGPGRTDAGNFVLKDLKIEVTPRLADGGSGTPKNITLVAARASHSQPGYPVESLLQPASGRRGWAIGLGPEGASHWAVFTFAEAVELPHGGVWTITLEQTYGTSHLLGCFRFSSGAFAAPNAGPQTETWNELAKQWRDARGRARQANAAFTPASLENWVFEGDGFLTGQTDEATPLVALEGDKVIERLLPQGWHSHALSSKLPASLRTPPQHLIPGKYVSLNLAGGEFGGHLVVDDHAFQNEAVVFYTNTEPEWRTFADAELMNGLQQVGIEFCTSSLNPNFPPRTGLARGLPNRDFGYNKRSWISITGIYSHDTPGTPQHELDAFRGLYESGTEGDSWGRIAAWLNGAVLRWCDEKPQPGDRPILEWLLKHDLLPNQAEPDSKLAQLIAEYRHVESSISFPRTVNSMDQRRAMPVKYPLNVRGNVDVLGEMVEPAFLAMLQGEGVSDRMALAESLLNPAHPLTARVYVNRVWLWIFGTGLVATPDDFGRLGEVPSHPELLDWLARQFIREGWSTKQLVRNLVQTETFRQSGQLSDGARERDPSNRLLSYYPTRRLEAEAIRDSLLVVSGRMTPRLYGRPILPYRTAEDDKKRLFSGPLDGEGRRSIYQQMSIMAPPKFLVGFNLPDLRLPTGRRDVTNVPTQALALLNDPMVIELTSDWGQKLAEAHSLSTEARLQGMFQAAFDRAPTTAESDRWLSALHAFGGDTPEGWSNLAHALVNTKEFIYYR
jgi:hypothetical protein